MSRVRGSIQEVVSGRPASLAVDELLQSREDALQLGGVLAGMVVAPIIAAGASRGISGLYGSHSVKVQLDKLESLKHKMNPQLYANLKSFLTKIQMGKNTHEDLEKEYEYLVYKADLPLLTRRRLRWLWNQKMQDRSLYGRGLQRLHIGPGAMTTTQAGRAVRKILRGVAA